MNEHEALIDLLTNGELTAEYRVFNEHGTMIGQCGSRNFDTYINVLLKHNPDRTLTFERRLILSGKPHPVEFR